MAPSAPSGPPPGEGRGARGPLVLVLMVALATRLPALAASHEGNMSPDAAHFLNIARCVARGQGFANPAAWPAWLQPERLPAPETFKDPGLPYAIALLTPLVGDPFRAGQLVSLAAGLLLPFAVYALGLRVARDRAVAWLAAMIAAASPVLVAQSARVMAESLFTLLVTLAFVAAAPRAGDPPVPGAAAPRRARADLAAGALLGLAFLVRGQALIAVPALLALAATATPRGTALARGARMLVAMTVVASPLLLRNLLRFGAPLHSDAATFAVWPFVDPLDFSHGLTRPPAPLPFALEHPGQLLAHTAAGLARFLRSALLRDLVGHPLWAPALAVGGVLAALRPRAWAFAALYLVPLAVLMSAVSWNTRYFASAAPLACLLTALGAMGLVRRAPVPHASAPARAMAAAALLALLALAAVRAWREVRGYAPPELAAAAAESPRLAARLRPDEALMAVTTSYWSWFADRPSVHLVIADEPAFLAVLRRHRVRWAALPTSRLAEFAARYPEGRLPAALVVDHADPARDVTVFAVRDTAAGSAAGR